MSKKDKAKKLGKKAKKAGTFSPSPASGITAPAEATEIPIHYVPFNAPIGFTGEATEIERNAAEAHAESFYRAKQDAEVARQWAHRAKIDYGLSAPTEPVAELIVNEIEHTVTDPSNNVVWQQAPNGDLWAPSKLEQSAATSGKDVPTPPAAPEHGPIGLEPAADPVLANGLGQAMIHFLDPATGKEKVKGYTRVTTYIDGLDDKTVLNKWKQRTLLEGAAIDFQQDGTGDGGSIASVGRALQRLDAALSDIDRREAVEGELLELRRQELLKEHRDFLESIGENLMDLGGAHDKATKGTNLHRLTELVDQGLPLPDDTTASDRRDVEAYQEKVKELGLEVLWTEKRVVLDDIQVSGTMDRAYLAKLPGMARRIRVVGDLKTGSVSWGQGKIACQLGLYSRGFGYDWAKPLEREPLRLSKAYGLLIHLPQGEGKCDIYVVDLELASEGLALAAKVREWRRTQKRAYDLHSPMQPATIGSPPPDAKE